MFHDIVALFPKDTITQAETKRQNRIIKKMRRNPVFWQVAITLVVLAILSIFTFIYIGVGK